MCNFNLYIYVFILLLQSKFTTRNKNLEEHIASLDTDLKSTSTDLYSTREQLAYCKAENKGLHDEMAVINQVKI